MKHFNFAFLISVSLAAQATTFMHAARAGDFVINVSGNDGVDGRNGASASFSGSSGGDATRSSPGQSAGNIQIQLSDTGNGRVQITGTHSGVYNTNGSGQIRLIAHGGKGGDGGNGGDGARGRSGTDGSDATEHSSGTDGGPGGPGGDGGNATPGSNGGPGGIITVRVKEKDMHVLYLLAQPQVNGGPGGRGSRVGQGGPGGSGGSGGDSYSWTTTNHRTCSGSRTVSNGNGGTTTVDYTYDCSTTEHHSNSGGSNGYSGRSGSSGSGDTSPGRAGSDGRYTFIVEYDNGSIAEYQSAFDLRVTSFELVRDFDDTFVQPGERIRIRNIQIQNIGGMPSPTKTGLRFRVAGSAGTTVDSQAFVDFGSSIQPGETRMIPGELSSEIVRSVLDSEAHHMGEHRDSVRRTFNIAPSIEILGINRFPHLLEYNRTVVAQFPVAISRILARRSLAQGDNTIIRWNVQNFSRLPLGASGNDGRHVRFISSFAFDGGGHSQAYSLTVQNGTEGAGNTQNVASIPRRSGNRPQESELLWSRFGFTDQAPLRASGTLTIELQIEDPYVPGRWIRADVLRYPIRVGTPFNKTPGADVLLVTNPQTTREEIAAWRLLVQSSGRQMDVWDIGINGVPDLAGQGLGNHYRGGTVIILNDLLRQAGSEVVPADAIFKLSPSNFTALAFAHKIGILVWDRTGSYKAQAGGFTSAIGRIPLNPMFVAVKVNESQFRNPDFINSNSTRLSLALTLAFDRKLLRLAQTPSQGGDYAGMSARAYGDAILSDLVMEQIYARGLENPTLANLPLLTRAANQGLMLTIQGGDLSALRTQFGQVALNITSKLKFLVREQDHTSSDQEVTNLSEPLIARMVLHTFNARDDWDANDAQRQAVALTNNAFEHRINQIHEITAQRETQIRDDDTARYFTFPRAWRGDYYRQAVYSVLLEPVYLRTYTHRLQIFDQVMTHDRYAIPSNY